MIGQFIQRARKSSTTTIRKAVTIPIQGGSGTFITFRGLKDDLEHVAIAFGDWKEQTRPLVRIHSECLTGDVFGSGKCDCGEQLAEAIAKMQSGGGLLLYLRQEGRGIGLYKKLDAYELQSQGYDTYEANRALGLKEDLRDYEVAAQMLRALGKEEIALLSNNPDKKQQLARYGIRVTQSQPTQVFLKPWNKNYLATKVIKTGHTIEFGKFLGAAHVAE
jgi:GTP cyclohydrolase II